MRWAILGACMALSGCCWLGKRSCFPSCPPTPPPRVVAVDRPCELPPLKLPSYKSVKVGCPEDHLCFDRPNAGRLWLRLSRLKDFAKEARAKCGKKPTTRPASKPATSQPTP